LIFSTSEELVLQECSVYKSSCSIEKYSYFGLKMFIPNEVILWVDGKEQSRWNVQPKTNRKRCVTYKFSIQFVWY